MHDPVDGRKWLRIPGLLERIKSPFEGNVGKKRRDERETIMVLKDTASHKTGRPSSRRIQNGGGRNSSIELLRLLSMLMIVSFHLCVGNSRYDWFLAQPPPPRRSPTSSSWEADGSGTSSSSPSPSDSCWTARTPSKAVSNVFGFSNANCFSGVLPYSPRPCSSARRDCIRGAC